MKLSLEEVSRDGNEVVVRINVFNDTFEPVEFDRRLLVGPNGMAPNAEPWPLSLEAPAKDKRQNVVLLNPFCLYGRERRFIVSQPTTFYGYLVSKAGGLLPSAPASSVDLVAAAEPITSVPV